jgi:hypothetical protein
MSSTHRRRRVVLRTVSLTLVALLTLGLLIPVLAGPVIGDDRYWFAWVGSERTFTPVSELQRVPEALDTRMGYGRVNVLTEIERRAVARIGMDVSVATRTPVDLFNTVLKLLLFVVAVLCALAMVRSLRWREASGALVRVSRNSLTLVAAAGTLGLAALARPHTEPQSTLNGWNAYPWSTYGAVPSIFGVVALAVWLSRLSAEGGRRTLALAMTVMALIGLATAFRYELVFPAVPLTVVALLVAPVTELARQREGRRAKLLVGGAYVGAFLPAFAVTRWLLRNACSDGGCYEGVKPEFGGAMFRALGVNVLSSFPIGDGGLTQSARAAGLPDAVPGPTGWSVLVGLLIILALACVWWAWRPETGSPATGDESPQAQPSVHAEARLLLVGAGLFLLGALGAAGVMSLSSRTQSVITELGILNRNAVATTTGLVFAIVLVVVAVCRLMPRRAAIGAWTAFAVLVAASAAYTLPGSAVMLRAQRVSTQGSEAIHNELAIGDLRPSGNNRRCRLMDRLVPNDGVIGAGSTRRMAVDTDNAFRRYYGRPFCTGDPVITRALAASQ